MIDHPYDLRILALFVEFIIYDNALSITIIYIHVNATHVEKYVFDYAEIKIALIINKK